VSERAATIPPAAISPLQSNPFPKQPVGAFLLPAGDRFRFRFGLATAGAATPAESNHAKNRKCDPDSDHGITIPADGVSGGVANRILGRKQTDIGRRRLDFSPSNFWLFSDSCG
jgi:hypothetical protein